jgi:NTE family protein
MDLVNRKAFTESGVIDVAEQDHKYMYLLDGGLVDNLGITPFFTAFSDGGIRYLLEEDKIDHLVMIIVDAGTAPPNDIERSASTPGGVTSLLTTATSGIHTNTWLLKAFARALYLRAIPDAKRAYELCDPGQAQDRAPEYTIDIYVADLNFASLEDYDERQRFLNLPTSFALDDEDIDALIAVGRQLVKDNPEIQRLLQNLGS